MNRKENCIRRLQNSFSTVSAVKVKKTKQNTAIMSPIHSPIKNSRFTKAKWVVKNSSSFAV